MEKELKIPIPETDLTIYAKQYGELDNPVVVFVHGLTGHMDEHQFYNGARYFYEHDISSVRFNLYDDPDDARKLVDCTLKTHAHDLNAVIDYLRTRGAKNIIAVGHSYGGPTILLADHGKLDGVVFWDASYDYRFDDTEPLSGTSWRYLDWSVWSIIGEEMYQEAQTMQQDQLLANLKTPIKVITAEKSYYEDRKKNYELASGSKEYHMIKGAGHTFAEEGAADELFRESVQWIKKLL
jgi:pimeloyl-ACP methyl ester carboxylesterase